MAADQYITLVSSLPALGPMLGAKHAPINRVRLQQRLRMLTPEHHAELVSLAGLLAWSRLPLAGKDEALVSRARRIIPTLSSPTLAALARDRLEMRTVTAALRRRQAGQEAPSSDDVWGYSRHLGRITANWNDPEFGLVRVYPWLPEARAALEKRDSKGLERVLLEAAWRNASQHSVGHEFDYEAVAIYLIRWNLLDRWTRYDEQAAAARFASLVEQALATAPEQFTETEAAA
ncbi:MAG: hypothetical protein AAF968_23555 [Pseudomonadota bacterium]